MSEREARDRRVLTLLVQLFGRDVLDRLAGAGFDGLAAIAHAGADRLAAEGGIPLALARRLAAVVEESNGPAPGVQEERRPAKTGARKRGEPRTPGAPPASAAATAPPTPQAEASPARDQPEERDPFVDDVALVSWMGLSARHPPGRLAFTVSDSILDPAEGDGPQPTERDGPPPAQGDGPQPAEARMEKPERPRTLTGSFWSFGRPVEATLPQAPTGTPRRRKHDDH
jgi:hypothetical protein